MRVVAKAHHWCDGGDAVATTSFDFQDEVFYFSDGF